MSTKDTQDETHSPTPVTFLTMSGTGTSQGKTKWSTPSVHRQEVPRGPSLSPLDVRSGLTVMSDTPEHVEDGERPES